MVEQISEKDEAGEGVQTVLGLVGHCKAFMPEDAGEAARVFSRSLCSYFFNIQYSYPHSTHSVLVILSVVSVTHHPLCSQGTQNQVGADRHSFNKPSKVRPLPWRVMGRRGFKGH